MFMVRRKQQNGKMLMKKKLKKCIQKFYLCLIKHHDMKYERVEIQFPEVLPFILVAGE
jgi:hypothetical protein